MDGAQTSATGTSAPYGHACTNCSKAKTRCISRAVGSCERCHRLQKDCTTSTTVRKRQSTRAASSSKRARLEEKLDDLVSLLQTQNIQKRAEPIPTPTAENANETEHPWIPKAWKGGVRRAAGVQSTDEAPTSVVLDSSNPFMEPIDMTPSTTAYSSPNASATQIGIDKLSPAKAEEMLRVFRSSHTLTTPFFYISTATTAHQLQQERPFLWLVIRGICSKSIVEQHKIGSQIRGILANQMLVELDRNIDLLLGLLAYLGWSMYFAQGKPYMCALCGLASALVHDLHLDRKARDTACTNPALNVFKPYAFPKPLSTANPKARTNEERRALLGCFFSTSIVSCYMRFEIARWKPNNMEEAMTHLWEVPETFSDRVLVALIRIMAVVDEAARLIARTDDQETALSLFHIKALLASLQQVKDGLTVDVLENTWVKVHTHSAEVTIYELAMFQPPSRSPFKPMDYKRREYLQACLEAAKSFLDSFLAIDIAEYHALPFWVIIEYAHSSQVLYRLTILDDPGWDRSMVRQTADVIYYLEQTSIKMGQAHELGDFGANGADGSLFSKASGSLKATIPIWSANLGQVGAFTAADNTLGDSDSIDPMLMDLMDDTWLTDMFASWEGH